jgi:hypothetical protein
LVGHRDRCAIDPEVDQSKSGGQARDSGTDDGDGAVGRNWALYERIVTRLPVAIREQ